MLSLQVFIKCKNGNHLFVSDMSLLNTQCSLRGNIYQQCKDACLVLQLWISVNFKYVLFVSWPLTYILFPNWLGLDNHSDLYWVCWIKLHAASSKASLWRRDDKQPFLWLGLFFLWWASRWQVRITQFL